MSTFLGGYLHSLLTSLGPEQGPMGQLPTTKEGYDKVPRMNAEIPIGPIAEETGIAKAAKELRDPAKASTRAAFSTIMSHYRAGTDEAGFEHFMNGVRAAMNEIAPKIAPK